MLQKLLAQLEGNQVPHMHNSHSVKGIGWHLSHALEGADVEGILGAAVARILALELAVGFFVRLRLLQRHDLGLSQHQPLLGHLRLQRLEPFPHGLQIMPEPDLPDAGGEDRQRLFP